MEKISGFLCLALCSAMISCLFWMPLARGAVGADATAATPLPTWTISGTITPEADGSGTTLTLTQGTTAIATAIADSAGAYAFASVADGIYVVTPSKTGFTFSPASQTVAVNGANVTVPPFTAPGAPPALLFPDLSIIIPTDLISVEQTPTGRVFQYTHDTFNGGPGPLVIQPTYNPASGNYQGTQYIYSLSESGEWSLSEQIPVAGAFVWHEVHGHFHYPFATFGLYKLAPDGSPGDPAVLSAKIGFCINDSFIYDPTLPNAGDIGNLGDCSDPTSLRGLDIGAVDEYDRTDDGQSIPIDDLPDGTYWLRAIVDPDNYLAESDKTNNETDVLLTITGTTVEILKTVVPVLPAPPSIDVTEPPSGATLSNSVQLTASTSETTGVQFLLDGQPLGDVLATAPYNLSWDTTTVPDGTHWLAAQTKGSTGRIGTSAVVAVSVSNLSTAPPSVQVTAPANGSILSATVTVFADVTSSFAVTDVTFYVDGIQLGTPLTSPPFMTTWDTRTATIGTHVVTASATDSAGRIGESAPVTVTVDNTHPPMVIGKDVVVSADGSGTITTTALSTPTAGDLLLAFVAYDGPATTPQTAVVSGAGLTWALLVRANTQAGTSEIWTARASGVLSAAAVSSQPGVGTDYHGSLTVIAFTNAAGTSAVSRMGALTGPPHIYLPGVVAGDWVFAVGNDWDDAIARVPVSGQVLVHQQIDPIVANTYWVQSTVAPSTANALVNIQDSSPRTDQWNYAAVEIVAAR
jgi:Bacterial Ig domain/Lysyl oxidase